MQDKKDVQSEEKETGQKTKKMEKQPADPHREYLDMDTDEEEFGKPETPEPEEEPPPEPEKPIFTEEELQELVQYVKDLTVLPALDDSDWNEECCSKVIREFFQNPSKIILTVFYDVDVLTALLGFPSDAVDGMTYFWRSPWQVYTTENFHATINFGSVSGNVENYILKIMENVYALGIFNSKDWYSVKRNDIFSNAHDLLTKLTDTTYKLMDLTVLYVPRDGMDPLFNVAQKQNQFILVTDNVGSEEASQDVNEVDEAKDEGDLMGRLETVANFWIRQIREAISDQNSASQLTRVSDELTFWEYRYDNLRGLCCHLENANILRIVAKLENMQFTSIRQFHELTNSVKMAIDEAISNINYLSLLTEPCSVLKIPEMEPEKISHILYLISFIWLESPFYNSKTKIETLSRALSTQIVSTCRESINLDTIFQGDTIQGQQQLQVCIGCCQKYKKIYNEHVEVISKTSQDRSWEVDAENVFNHVDAFIRRCRDVLEICDTVVVFGKSPKSMNFGGSNGIAYETSCNRIETMFYSALQKIKDVQHKILDVMDATWLQHVTLFRQDIAELEVMVGNVVTSIFSELSCIEESIEALYTLQRYSRRESINELLHLKWAEVWKIFDKEIQQSKLAIINQSQHYHSSTPYYSGRAFILRLRHSRLTRYQTILTNASDWLEDCDAQITVLRNYKKLIAAAVDEEKLLFDAWEKLMPEGNELTSTLSEPILRRGKSKFGPIEVNMDYRLLNSMEEAKVWVWLSYEVDTRWKKLSTKWLTLKIRYQGVSLLCRSYNRVLKLFTHHERSLFKEVLKNLENSVACGFDKTTWHSPDVERFYTECSADVMNLQELIGLYKKADSRIEQLFWEISNVRSVQVLDNVIFSNEEFLSTLEKQVSQEISDITKHYEEVLRLLMGIKKIFEIDLEEIAQYWADFIQSKDNQFEQALCSAIVNLLQSVLRLTEGDEISIWKPFFRITVHYINNELIIWAEVQKLKEVFKNIFKYTITAIKPLELLSVKLDVDVDDATEFWKSIEDCETYLNLQKTLDTQFDDLNTAINDYIQPIHCIKEITSIDVTRVSQYYAENEPNREILEHDIRRCTKLAGGIEKIANKTPVNFVVLDMIEAKLKMMEKCESWREILLIELSKVIVTEQEFDAGTPTTVEELSLCSYEGSDNSN